MYANPRYEHITGCLNPPKTIKTKKIGRDSSEFWCPLCNQTNKTQIHQNPTNESKKNDVFFTNQQAICTNLNTVEEFVILGICFSSVECWVWNIIPSTENFVKFQIRAIRMKVKQCLFGNITSFELCRPESAYTDWGNSRQWGWEWCSHTLSAKFQLFRSSFFSGEDLKMINWKLGRIQHLRL